MNKTVTALTPLKRINLPPNYQVHLRFWRAAYGTLQGA
jgi:hypothetical protein